jgi:hypothetical protein
MYPCIAASCYARVGGARAGGEVYLILVPRNFGGCRQEKITQNSGGVQASADDAEVSRRGVRCTAEPDKLWELSRFALAFAFCWANGGIAVGRR